MTTMSDHHLRIVIVEDEEAQRRQLVSWLMENVGVVIVGVAGDGLEAIDTIERTTPDLILLDISLPELDGLSVLARLQHKPDVIFTTAFRDFAIEAFVLGAIDYLLKPFGSTRRLHARGRGGRSSRRNRATAPCSAWRR